MSNEITSSNSSIPQKPDTFEKSVAATDNESGIMQGLPPEIKVRSKRRKKTSYLTIQKIKNVDYKDIPLLKKFLNEFGKLVPARQSGNTAHQQRMVTRAVKRAREMALLPFIPSEPLSDRFYPRQYKPRDRQARPVQREEDKN